MSRPPKPVRYEKKPMRRNPARATGAWSRGVPRVAASLPNAPRGTPGNRRWPDAGRDAARRGARAAARRRSGSRPGFRRSAPRRGPGSRSRPRGPPTPSTSRTSRASSGRGLRNVTSVTSTAVVTSPPLDERDAADDLVGAAGEPLQVLARLRPRRAGLPRISPSSTTIVSAPRTSVAARPPAPCAARSPPRPRAGRRAVSSSTPETRTSKAMPACSRIARRWGEAEARIRGSGKNSFASRSADSARVRAVDHVLADLDGEVAADRAGGGLERVGRADHLARGAHGLVALEHHRDERAGGDEARRARRRTACPRARRSAARRAARPSSCA